MRAEDSQIPNPASETLENQGLQEPEIDISGKDRTLAFERINEVTWKLTDGRGSLAWSGDRSGSYRTSRALAWLMGIGGGLWIVRYRDKSSKPMKLPKAKVYALEMVKGIRPGLVIADPIGRLHRLHLDVQEPMPEIAQVWAIETADVVGGVVSEHPGNVNPNASQEATDPFNGQLKLKGWVK